MVVGPFGRCLESWWFSHIQPHTLSLTSHPSSLAPFSLPFSHLSYHGATPQSSCYTPVAGNVQIGRPVIIVHLYLAMSCSAGVPFAGPCPHRPDGSLVPVDALLLRHEQLHLICTARFQYKSCPWPFFEAQMCLPIPKIDLLSNLRSMFSRH